jgi:hypothetical protein
MPRLVSRGIAFNSGPGDLEAGARPSLESPFGSTSAATPALIRTAQTAHCWQANAAGSAISVANAVRGGIPGAAALPGDIRIGRSSNPARRRHSDIIASFATATMEFFKGSLRKHPTPSRTATAADKASVHASKLAARIALLTTMARTASTLKSRRFFAVRQIHLLARSAVH